VIIINYQNNLY